MDLRKQLFCFVVGFRNLAGGADRMSEAMDEGAIVVANDLPPSETATLNQNQVAGFAIDLGSQTSHTAIMARALEIPAVVGLHDISIRVNDGDQMVGFWAVAAKPKGSTGVDSLYTVPLMFTNNHRIGRNSELGSLKLETYKERFDIVPETGDRRYEVKIQKAELRWDGHLAGEEPNPGVTREWAFLFAGKFTDKPFFGGFNRY